MKFTTFTYGLLILFKILRLSHGGCVMRTLHVCANSISRIMLKSPAAKLQNGFLTVDLLKHDPWGNETKIQSDQRWRHTDWAAGGGLSSARHGKGDAIKSQMLGASRVRVGYWYIDRVHKARPAWLMLCPHGSFKWIPSQFSFGASSYYATSATCGSDLVLQWIWAIILKASHNSSHLFSINIFKYLYYIIFILFFAL